MEVHKLTEYSLKPAIAQVYKSKTTDEMYYNIKHGTNDTGNYTYYVYNCGLHSRYFKPKSMGDEMVLDKNHYICVPLKSPDNVWVKDRRGNPIYLISIDHSELHKKDQIIFWEIPNKDFVTTTYSISGSVCVLAEGVNIKERSPFGIGSTNSDEVIKYKSPAPVLEVQGPCRLQWKGVDKHGDIYEQTIYRDENDLRWVFEKIKHTEVKKDGE